MNLTIYRKIFIIDILSDCKKWKTQELLKEIHKLEKKHSIKSSKITSAKLSPILSDLSNDSIIATEAIPKAERKGRGPGGDRHWLVKNITNLNKIISLFTYFISNQGELGFFENSGNFYDYGNKLINSEYGKALINDKLISYIETQCAISLNDDEKAMALQILKMSPSAIMGINILSYKIIAMEINAATKENMSIFEVSELKVKAAESIKESIQKGEWNDETGIELSTTPEFRKSAFFRTLYDRLNFDFSHPNFKSPYSFEYKSSLIIYPKKKLEGKYDLVMYTLSDKEGHGIETDLKYS